MNSAIQAMLGKYKRDTVEANLNALREIFQEIALCGLWRSKFFEKAAFYGGTALRVLHELDRFSEDMDFSLLVPDPEFDISPYLPFMEQELEAWGFSAVIVKKKKKADSQVESAFLKADTIEQLIQIEVKSGELTAIPRGHLLRIKIEVDVNPPAGFDTETRYLLLPVPFSVRVYSLPSSFAGKMHALLCRQWKSRVKGRDWYDFLWYLGRQVRLDLNHLKSRMIQSGHLEPASPWNREVFLNMVRDRIQEVDFNLAKDDVRRFLSNPGSLELWSREFFQSMKDKILIE